MSLILSVCAAAMGQPAEVCCTVTVFVKTDQGQPVPGAAIRIESGAISYKARSGDHGGAAIDLRTPGSYRAIAEAEGFAPQTREFQIARDAAARIEVILKRRDSVTVEARSSSLDPNAPPVSAATRDQVRSLPERVADVRNALPLIPGVVRTPEGKLQISGSPEYKSTFLVNSVDVTNPATGGFGATVPIDVIETMQVYKSPFLAEYGRFSSAVVTVATRRGGDKWHFELNDPTPEFRIRSGHLHGVRGFTPRFAATGPLVRGKLFFAGAGSFELRKRPVYPLPFPYNEEKTQRVNAYTQFDYIPRATHLVTVSLHGVPQKADFVNLSFYRPQTAAPWSRSYEYRAVVTDRMDTAFGVFETSLSAAELRGRTGGQGELPLGLTPVTSLGNYFLDQDRRTQRGELTETWSPRSIRKHGTHSLKFGGGAARTTLDGYAFARPVNIVSGEGDLLSGLRYRNQPPFRLANWDANVFAQDGWEPLPQLRIDAGLRVDYQQLARITTVAPRAGLAWTPGESGGTVLRGGLGWFYDRVPLNVTAFPQYPERFSLPNRLDRAGGFAPRSRTVSAAVDQRLSPAVLLHAGYVHSNHSRLLVIDPEPAATVLRGSGSARTSELELTAKLTWYAEQHWIISYVHTRARGNLNNFDQFLGDFPEPLIRADAIARLPAVVPHRFLSWGVFPLPYGLRFAPVLEWRNGFPYSALDEYQQYADAPNSRALSAFFSLDTRISKDVGFRGHKARFSFSVFNVTNHANYDAVRLNTADAQFGELLGRRPRRFRLDFDWLF